MYYIVYMYMYYIVYIPYAWVDSLDKLDSTSVPEMDDFYSKMKMANPVESESD